jgi:outer membrane lipoprotein-sorting protein
MKNWINQNSRRGFPRFVLGLLLIAAAGAGPAAADSKALTVQEISDKVEAAQAGALDSQMNISMEMKDALSGQIQKLEGIVQMKAPDKIFVHYTKPSEQFLYMGSGMVKMYQPDQKTVYEQKGSEAAPIYLGVGRELKKYMEISKVSILQDNDSEVRLSFTPRDKVAAGFDSMKVFIHKKDWWPYQMEVEAASGKTTARFSNFSFNKGLKDSLFEFKAPQGVETVQGVIF